RDHRRAGPAGGRGDRRAGVLGVAVVHQRAARVGVHHRCVGVDGHRVAPSGRDRRSAGRPPGRAAGGGGCGGRGGRGAGDAVVPGADGGGDGGDGGGGRGGRAAARGPRGVGAD